MLKLNCLMNKDVKIKENMKPNNTFVKLHKIDLFKAKK